MLGITGSERDLLIKEYIPFFLERLQPSNCSKKIFSGTGAMSCKLNEDREIAYAGTGAPSCKGLYDSAALKKSLEWAAGQKDARSHLAIHEIPAMLLKCTPSGFSDLHPEYDAIIPWGLAHAINESEDLTTWGISNYFITNVMWFIAHSPNQGAVVEILQAMQKSAIPLSWVPIIKNGIQVAKDRAVEGQGSALKAKYLYEVEAHIDQVIADQAAEAARKAAAAAANQQPPPSQVDPLLFLPGYGQAIPPVKPSKKASLKSLAILGGAVAFAGAIIVTSLRHRRV